LISRQIWIPCSTGMWSSCSFISQQNTRRQTTSWIRCAVGQNNPAGWECDARLSKHEHQVLLLGRWQWPAGPQERHDDAIMEHHPERWQSAQNHVARQAHVRLPRELHHVTDHVSLAAAGMGATPTRNNSITNPTPHLPHDTTGPTSFIWTLVDQFSPFLQCDVIFYHSSCRKVTHTAVFISRSRVNCVCNVCSARGKAVP